MQTKKLFYTDPYLTKTESTVLSCEKAEKGWNIILDSTVFYPTGGGQPCDLGALGDANVLDVSEQDGMIIHLCDHALPVGEIVHGEIDWERRFSLMQQHSGEHLVSGIVHSRFGYDNVGFHMGKDVITIDFSGELSQEELLEVELAANAAIWRNIPTTVFYPDAERLAVLPYRSKKALSGEVRLVQFGDIDLCACCGIHVSHTGEIGLIKLLSSTRFHSGSRIELLCGKRALEWLNTVCGQNREISGLLSAKPFETAAAVRRMKEEAAKLQYRTTALENRLFAMQAEALKDQGNVLVFEEAMEPAALRRYADLILHCCGGRCCVFAGSEGSYSYAMGALDGDLRELTRELNTALNGRGGGKPGFVQGSVSATRKEIEAFFENR